MAPREWLEGTPEQRASEPILPVAGYSDGMAHIVILTHTFDDFHKRRYLLRDLLEHWKLLGHRVSVTEGLQDWPDADIAVLHLDLSLVPDAYVRACKKYPQVINGAALDIRKRLVSRLILKRDDDWDGPVIVKTNLNRGGVPEMRYFHMLKNAGLRSPISQEGMVFSQQPYAIHASKAEVNPSMWEHEGIVVERFLPERTTDGYAMRIWVFLGPASRCVRLFGTDPLIKSGGIVGRESVEIPDALHAERKRLGFDFGKFDFVMHQGQAMLLDANRTPFSPTLKDSPDMVRDNGRLALGLQPWLAAV